MGELRKDKLIPKLLMEAFGVFSICYWTGYAAEWNMQGELDFTGAVLATVALLSFLIPIGIEISGAHYNPVVTFVLWYYGKIEKKEAIRYVVYQMVGSLMGGFALMLTKPGRFETTITARRQLGFCAIRPGIHVFMAFLTEITATGFLLFVVMHSVHRPYSPYKVGWFVSIAIGALVIAFSPFTGCCMNPARIFGPALITGRLFDEGFWIYYIGSMIGGMAGASLYRFLFMDDEKCERSSVVSLELLPRLQVEMCERDASLSVHIMEVKVPILNG